MATEHVTTGETRNDLQAAVAARRDLGADYEPEVIDAFMEKLDARIAARVDQEVAARTAQLPAAPQPPRKGDNAATWVALASLTFGVPMTAIAAEQSGIIGTMVTWAGIATINLAHAIGRWGRPS
jgi:hypothetical protein